MHSVGIMPWLSEQPRELPDSHAWPALYDQYPLSDPSSLDAIPIIDLAGADVDVVPLIGRACREWGAFQITGHGVPVGLLDRLESQIGRLFSLPADQKLKVARGPGKHTGYGTHTISEFFSKSLWSEGYTVVGSPLENAQKLWPVEGDYSEFCVVIEEYMRRMKGLAARLVRLMLLSLGLDEAEIKSVGPLKDYDQAPPVLQLNSYPPCPDPDRAIGLAIHRDSSLITIIHQSNTTGLQVLQGEDSAAARWVTVPALPGVLVVNVGDLSHIFSNGRFRNVLHRAIVNQSCLRVSAAYFCGPPAHVEVSPLEKLLGPREGPAYRAVTWPDYVMLKKKLFTKALESLKLTEEAGKGG